MSDGASAASWTPATGMILRHGTINQTVEVTGTMVVGVMTFWKVRLHKAYGDPAPWFIAESALLEQYTPETK